MSCQILELSLGEKSCKMSLVHDASRHCGYVVNDFDPTCHFFQEAVNLVTPFFFCQSGPRQCISFC